MVLRVLVACTAAQVEQIDLSTQNVIYKGTKEYSSSHPFPLQPPGVVGNLIKVTCD